MYFFLKSQYKTYPEKYLCSTFYFLVSLTVSKTKWCAFLGIQVMVDSPGKAVHGIMTSLCSFPVTFSYVLPGAYHLTRDKTRRRLGILPMLPIAPFSTWPTQKLVSCLPFYPTSQIKWFSIPYQIPISNVPLQGTLSQTFIAEHKFKPRGAYF